MGVSGSGKTTIGRALAERWAVPFVDADDLHPASNRAKMAAGAPLTDADREPWLADVAAWLGRHADGGVTACSALRRAYRDRLQTHGPVRFVLLHGDRSLLERRLSDRSGHFMPTSLLDSQLATLEPLQPDEPGAVVDIGSEADEVVAEAATAVGRIGLHPRGR